MTDLDDRSDATGSEERELWATDALLDALGAGEEVGSDRAAALLCALRADVGLTPLPVLPDLAVARRRRRGRLAPRTGITVAAAVVVLSTGGVAAASVQACPTSALFPLHQVLTGQPQLDSSERQALEVQDRLRSAAKALAAGKVDRAQKDVAAAAGRLPRISASDGRRDLSAQWAAINRQVAAKLPARTDVPVPVPVPVPAVPTPAPSPAPHTPGTTPAPTSSSSASPTRPPRPRPTVARPTSTRTSPTGRPTTSPPTPTAPVRTVPPTSPAMSPSPGTSASPAPGVSPPTGLVTPGAGTTPATPSVPPTPEESSPGPGASAAPPTTSTALRRNRPGRGDGSAGPPAAAAPPAPSLAPPSSTPGAVPMPSLDPPAPLADVPASGSAAGVAG